VKNTLIYIDLETACYPKTSDAYIAKLARTQKEILDLIEGGFEYVCDFEDGKILRKRK
jgi:hypothetical protein